MVLYACACCLIRYKRHLLTSILQLQSESSVNCDCKRLPRNRCGSLQLVDYVCKTVPTRHTILIVYYIKSCCSVILESPRLRLKSPYYYHFQLFFPSDHACMSASVCWDYRWKKAFFFPAVYFSSLRQSYLPESKHLSLWLMDCRSLTLPCVFKGKRVWSTGKSTGWLGETRYWNILTWLLKVPSRIYRIQADSFLLCL